MAAGSTIHAIRNTLRVKVVNDDGHPPTTGRMIVKYRLPARADGDVMVRSIRHEADLRVGDDVDDTGAPVVDPALGTPRQVGYLDVPIDTTHNAAIAGSDGSYEVTLVIDGDNIGPYWVEAPAEADGIINAGPAMAGAYPPGTPVSTLTRAMLAAALAPIERDIADLKGRPAGETVTTESIGAVPASRRIAVGAGLTGSSNLTKDVTIGVFYGTTEGTVAEGNHLHAPPTVEAVTGLQEALAAKTSLADVKAEVSAVVGGAPAALDTLKEIADALASDEGATAALTTAVGNRVRVDAAQALTDTQQATARANIGAADAASVTAAQARLAALDGGTAATGTRSADTFLAGDGTWRVPPAGAGGTGGSDPDAVKLTGDQTIAGVKTFQAAPVVPTGAFTFAAIGGLQGALDGKAATAHTHTAEQVSDATSVGRAVMTAADKSAARTAIGAGTATVKPVSEAEYAALPSKDPYTLYFTADAIYYGASKVWPPTANAQPIYAETFGTDGSSWPSGWAPLSVPTGASATVASGVGVITYGTTGTWSDNDVIVVARNVAEADYDLTVRVRKADAFGTLLQVAVRAPNPPADAGTGIYVTLDADSTLHVDDLNNFASTRLGSVSYGHSSGSWHRLRIRVQGASVKVKAWPAASAEPTAWAIDATTTLTAAGRLAFRIGGGATAGKRTVSIDDLTLMPA